MLRIVFFDDTLQNISKQDVDNVSYIVNEYFSRIIHFTTIFNSSKCLQADVLTNQLSFLRLENMRRLFLRIGEELVAIFCFVVV
mmetsp:Transcript_28975/g.35316  ORF Transcript_28975/g.35316 Transcript_28975/m.35316 type:complete len:84 (-) Transcript_28975:35-286(-)